MRRLLVVWWLVAKKRKKIFITIYSFRVERMRKNSLWCRLSVFIVLTFSLSLFISSHLHTFPFIQLSRQILIHVFMCVKGDSFSAHFRDCLQHLPWDTRKSRIFLYSFLFGFYSMMQMMGSYKLKGACLVWNYSFLSLINI